MVTKIRQLRLRWVWRRSKKLELDDSGSGVAAMKAYAERHPNDHQAWGGLAEWLFWQGDGDGALQAARNSYRLRRDRFTSNRLLFGLRLADRWEELETLATARAEVSPEDPTCHILLAEVAEELGDEESRFAHASNALERVRAGGTIPQWGLFLLGLTFASRRDCRDTAIEVFSRLGQLPHGGREWTVAHLLLVLLQTGRSQWHAEWSRRRVMEAKGWSETEFEEELDLVRDHYRDLLADHDEL